MYVFSSRASPPDLQNSGFFSAVHPRPGNRPIPVRDSAAGSARSPHRPSHHFAYHSAEALLPTTDSARHSDRLRNPAGLLPAGVLQAPVRIPAVLSWSDDEWPLPDHPSRNHPPPADSTFYPSDLPSYPSVLILLFLSYCSSVHFRVSLIFI